MYIDLPTVSGDRVFPICVYRFDEFTEFSETYADSPVKYL